MLVHLIFDLDGTLIDSSSGIYSSFCYSCERFQLPQPNLSLFRGMIGPPVQDLLLKIYPESDSDLVNDFRICFREHYDSHGFSDFVWYPGVVSCLNFFKKDPSLCMSIVTNKPTRPAIEILNTQNLMCAFDRVVGIDYLNIKGNGSSFRSKSHALEYVTRTTSSNPEVSLYVGDTPGDHIACLEVGLPFVPVLYGFHQWETVNQFTRSIAHFPEIREHLADIKSSYSGLS